MRRFFFALMGMAACGGDDSTIAPPGDGGPQNDTGPGADGNNGTDGNNGMDSGGADTSMGADAASFDIKDINGLALWLKGDMGVTADGMQRISNWADQSGNANDGTNPGGAVDTRPSAVASGINGLPTVHFASTACTSGCTGFYGNDLFICQPPNCTHASMNWGTGDYLVEVVARYTNDPTSMTGDGFGALFISIYGPPEGATGGVGLYGNVPALNNNAKSSGIEAFTGGQPAAVSSGTGYNDNMPHVFGMQRAGTNLSVRLDGASVGTSVVAAIDVGNHGGRLGGCENAQAQRLEGDISEVIAVKGTVSAGDLATIESYLKARYSTP